MPQRDDVFWCNRHDVFWLSGYGDSQARNFGGDPPKFQQIARHNGRANLSRRESNEHVVHGYQAISQARCISIHGSKELSSMVENCRREAEDASGLECLIESVNSFLTLREGLIYSSCAMCYG